MFVAPGGRSLLNLYIPTVAVSCSPSGNTGIPVGIPTAAIQPDGAFNITAAQDAIIDGNGAKVTYTVQGRFQVATATAPASAAGTWSEHIAYTSGTITACSSNSQSWTAALYREPPWQKSAIAPGSYTGPAGQGWDLIFTVTPNSHNILNVSIPTAAVSCNSSINIANQPVTIPTITIQPDGSFATKTSQDGMISGNNAKITYTFSGYFEGPTPTGAITVAGTWREDIVFSSGPTTTCTSNNQSWSAIRT
jgi:hypothetical protein